MLESPWHAVTMNTTDLILTNTIVHYISKELPYSNSEMFLHRTPPSDRIPMTHKLTEFTIKKMYLHQGPALGIWPSGDANFRRHHFVSCREIPDSTWAWIGFHFVTHCNAIQRTRNAANRCVLRSYNTANAAAARNPAGLAYNAPQDHLVGFKWSGKGEKGKEGEERAGREVEGGEVDYDNIAATARM